MARNSGPILPGDDSTSRAELVRAGRDGARSYAAAAVDDYPPLDLDVEEQSPFLRAQKRVPVRRGALPRKAATRLRQAILALALLGAVAVTMAAVYNYGRRNWRFRINSSDNIDISPTQHVSRSQVLRVMGGDIGRNIFFVPLEERSKELGEIPWVESATVMRFLPDHLKIELRERTPVGFVQVGSRIALIDANGVVMEMPAGAQKKYSFPVIVGMRENEPLSTRAARMKIFADLVRDLDSGGSRYAQDLSEVDLSDPDDVKIAVSDPEGDVLVHLGSSNFLDRYKIYVAHVQEWRQQYQKLDSVDLRYEGQVILNPDSPGAHETVRAGPTKPPAGKMAPRAKWGRR